MLSFCMDEIYFCFENMNDCFCALSLMVILTNIIFFESFMCMIKLDVFLIRCLVLLGNRKCDLFSRVTSIRIIYGPSCLIE